MKLLMHCLLGLIALSSCKPTSESKLATSTDDSQKESLFKDIAGDVTQICDAFHKGTSDKCSCDNLNFKLTTPSYLSLYKIEQLTAIHRGGAKILDELKSTFGQQILASIATSKSDSKSTCSLELVASAYSQNTPIYEPYWHFWQTQIGTTMRYSLSFYNPSQVTKFNAAAVLQRQNRFWNDKNTQAIAAAGKFIKIALADDFLDIPTANFEEILTNLTMLTDNAENIRTHLASTHPSGVPAPSAQIFIALGGQNSQTIYTTKSNGVTTDATYNLVLDLAKNSPKTVFKKLAYKGFSTNWKVY